MMNLNRTDIIGNVGSIPEMRFTPSGKPVTSFTVACNRRYTVEGERKEATEWFSVVTWGKLAEVSNQFVTKGMPVYISGRIELHKWQSKDDIERSNLQLNANTVIFLSKNGDNAKASSNELEPEDTPF